MCALVRSDPERLEIVFYGVPAYNPIGYAGAFRIPFIKINVHNDVVVNAYRYLVYRLSQYAYIKEGIILKDYDPSTGTVEAVLPEHTQVKAPSEVEKLLRKVYEEFVSDYLVPKLLKHLRERGLDEILSTFYRRRRRGETQTGLFSVILPVRHVELYPDKVTEYAIQKKSIRELQSNKDKILEKLRELRERGELSNGDIVIVEKKAIGEIRRLSEDRIEGALKRLPERVMQTDIKSIKEKRKSAGDKGKCCFCGINIGRDEPEFETTGRLGLGRYRLPHEASTDLSGKGLMCLRCVIVSMFYVLDGGEDSILYAFNGLLSATRFEQRLSKRSTLDIATSMARVIKDSVPEDWAVSMILNSAFGGDRAEINVEGLDEVAIERLALLSSLLPGRILMDENVQRVLIRYIRSDFSEFVSHLVYILKQSEKGGDFMSRVSKRISMYITPYLYRESKEMRVAYTIATLAEYIAYKLSEKGADEYTIREFADNLRTGGLVTAIAYSIPRIGEEIKTLRVSELADKTIIKEVLDRYEFKYKEEGGAIYVYLDSIPPAETRIIDEYGRKIMLRAYDVLALLYPRVVLKKEETKETQGE